MLTVQKGSDIDGVRDVTGDTEAESQIQDKERATSTFLEEMQHESITNYNILQVGPQKHV